MNIHNGNYIKRYGSWHWGIIGTDGLFKRRKDGKLLLFKSKNEAQQFLDNNYSNCEDVKNEC